MSTRAIDDIGGGSSPRSWGCFSASKKLRALVTVFPTLVGVFPRSASYPRDSCRLPHARGGVSRPAPTLYRSCSLPHARGGVSRLLILVQRPRESSPRSWGCFRCHLRRPAVIVVFPTLVGVFLLLHGYASKSERLPHARGGVSTPVTKSVTTLKSSPRSWGCFC